jgi:hypothetical protein
LKKRDLHPVASRRICMHKTKVCTDFVHCTLAGR